MIRVKVTNDMLKIAEERKSYFDKYEDRGTHRIDKKRHKITGYLAEAAVDAYFSNLEFSDTEDVDFKTSHYGFDVKAQGCNTVPKPHFSATLYEEQRKRFTDFYIFCRVKNDSSEVYICGYIKKDDFFKKSQLMKAGTKTKNFTYDQSRYEIAYKDLKNPEELKEF